MALDLYNVVVIERADRFSIELRGEGSETIEQNEQNVLVRMTAKALGLMGKEMPPLRFECHNAVTPRRGLGSSSTAIVAGLAAGLALGGKELYTSSTKKLLFNLAAAEEFHYKRMRHARIAPTVFGGVQISFHHEADGQWVSQRVHTPPGLQCVLFIPDDEHCTAQEARDVLPSTLSYADTIHNIARTAILINCFETAQFSPLRFAVEDRLHQQHRAKLFPYCEPLIQAALKAGAHGAFLSGAGPTVVAIAGGVGIADPGSDTMSQFLAKAVCAEMHEAATRLGVAGSLHITEPSVAGLTSAGYDEKGGKLWGDEYTASYERGGTLWGGRSGPSCEL